MDWSHYYHQPLTLKSLLGNLYGQRDFLDAIVGTRAKSILEVGSGSGGMAIFLSWLGLSVTSIDIEPSVTAKAVAENQRLNGSAKFLVADGFHMPFNDGQFDLAIHQGLLEHFNDDEIRHLLDEQLRVAKQVFFSVPNANYMRKDFGNERLMTKSQWEAILSPYKIIQSRDYSPKRFPKFFLPRANIQFMALITTK